MACRPMSSEALFRCTLFLLPFGFPSGFPVLYVQALPFDRQRSHVGRSPEQRTLQR
jgi:hypothetical protein